MSLQFVILNPDGGVKSPQPVSSTTLPSTSQNTTTTLSTNKPNVVPQKDIKPNGQLLLPIVSLNNGKLNLNPIQVRQNSTLNPTENAVNNQPVLLLSMNNINSNSSNEPTIPSSLGNNSNEPLIPTPLNMNALCFVTPTSKLSSNKSIKINKTLPLTSILQTLQNVTTPVNGSTSIFINKPAINMKRNLPNVNNSIPVKPTVKSEPQPDSTRSLNFLSKIDISEKGNSEIRSTEQKFAEFVKVEQEPCDEPEIVTIKAEPPSDDESVADPLEEPEQLIHFDRDRTYDHQMADPLQIKEPATSCGTTSASTTPLLVKYVLVKNTNPPMYRNVICPAQDAASINTCMIKHLNSPNPAFINNGQNWKPSYFQQPKKLYNMADKNVKTIIKNMKYRYVKVCHDPPLYEKVRIHEEKLLETVIAGKTDRLAEMIANRPLKIVENLKNGKVPKLRVKTFHKCPDCDYSSDRKAQLTRHRKVHEKRGFQFCTFCGYKAVSWSDLYQHLDKEHPGEQAFKCPVCDYRATKKHSLVTHMAKHGMCQPGSLHKCPDCDYSTIWRGSLRNHRITRHSGRDKQFECSECYFKTYTNELLILHEKIHSKKKSVACPHCPFTTRMSQTLKVHLRQHSGEKPYVCSLCDYRAAQSISLSSHIKRHHRKELNFHCLLCEYKTIDARSLKVHMKVHREFTCYHCNATVTSIRKIRSHIIRYHTSLEKKIES